MSPDPLPQASGADYFRQGIREAFGVPSLVLMASLVGVGGLARDVGYPLMAGVLSTVLVWAGPAQVLLFGSLAAGAALPVIALAVCFSSIRFLPMTVSLLPLIRHKGLKTWQLFAAAHLIAVTNWTEGMRRLPDLPRDGRYSYFMGFGITTLLSATFATGAGYYLIGQLPPVFAAALLFTTPLFFAISLTAGAHHVWEKLSLVFGFALAPLFTAVVGKEFDLLASGVIGGSLAYAVHRLRTRPAR